MREEDQFLRVSDRQQLEHYRIDKCEDGRVRPDAEGEREHSHGGETGILQLLANGEFEVVHGSWSVESLGAAASWIAVAERKRNSPDGQMLA